MKLSFAAFSMIYFLAIGVGPSAEPSATPDDKGRASMYVSLISIIASPDKYDKKVVQIKGYLVTDFEHNAIYVSKSDAENQVTKNGLWIGFASSLDRELPKRFNRKWVFVQGTMTSS